VSAASARIGDGRSTLQDGIISAANAGAAQAGAVTGMPALDWARLLVRRAERDAGR
jgi:hypothetical protein